MELISSDQQACTGDSADISQSGQDGQVGTDLSLPAQSVQGESATNLLLIPARRALWKILDQFTTTCQRALQKLYQELADIKSARAMLEGNRTMTSMVSESQGVAINPPSTVAPQASWNSLAYAVPWCKTRRVIARKRKTKMTTQPIGNRLAGPLLAQCSEWVMASLPVGNG